MTKLNDKKMTTKTIKFYLNEVKFYQINISISPQNLKVFHYSMLERIVASIKRLIKEKDKKKRKPITREILVQLLNNLDQKILNGAVLHAAYSMAFAIFLKCEEFTYTVREADSSNFDA